MRSFIGLLACMILAWSSWLLGLQSPGVQPPAGWATVTGRVLDADGRPVPGAKISILPLDVAVSGGMPREPATDQEGRYRLLSPAYPGRSRLSAFKESAGYPNPQYLLFASGSESMPEVHLAPDARLDGVDIRLGTPDGTVEGTVLDAKTHAPVPKARITLHRRDPESVSSGTLPPDGHFFYALPHAAIEVTVDAPGYISWKYRDTASGAYWLLLSGTDHREIIVELEPR